MNDFAPNIQAITAKIKYFRQALYRARNDPTVVTALQSEEEIGMEVPLFDQTFQVQAGRGEAFLDGIYTAVCQDFTVNIPAGMEHDIIDPSRVPLRLYPIYTAPSQLDKVTRPTRVGPEIEDRLFDHFPLALKACE
jgi:mannose-6-phosphate isomerase-like protein (cupin superfamily)